MSYLDTPRLSFAGRFYADPSTVDNNRNNFNLGVPLNEDPGGPNNNYSVGWNSQGTHVFRLDGCTVRSVDTGGGPVTAGDPLVGAAVESTLDVYKYPAKLVDLDPDQQSVSQVWGLAVRVAVPDPADPTKPLAAVTGVMPATAFADMWTRVIGTPGGIPFFSAVFTSVLTNLKWVTPGHSPALAALAKASPTQLSIRLIVDSYQARSLEPTFGFGRLVGTIGPAQAGEPQRFVAGRRLSAAPNPQTGSPPYGPVPAVFDAASNRLTLDLGNFVPTIIGSGNRTVPIGGWPVRQSTFELTVTPPGTPTAAAPHFPSPKSAAVDLPAPTGPVLATIPFGSADYVTTAGVVAVTLTPEQARLVATAPLKLVDTTSAPGARVDAVAENPTGLYVDVSQTFYRLNPGETATVTLTALRFGQPAPGVALDLAYQPQGNPDPNNYPPAALPIPQSLTTSPAGTVDLTLTAGDPGGARRDMNIDGQVYFIGGSWTNYGNIFPLQSAPINVLVFDGYPVPAAPTWAGQVGPILSYYAQVYPYMKTIIDLADRDTVVQNAAAIAYVLSLPADHPHYMPVLRDLSAGKRQMILDWLNSSAQP